MKILNKEFMQAMKDHKAIKTILKSPANTMTIDMGTIRLDLFQDNEHTQVVIDADITTEDTVVLDSDILDVLCKLKPKDDVDITDTITIDGKPLDYTKDVTVVDKIPTYNQVRMFKCLASDFKKALKEVILAIGHDQVRPTLNNILLDGDIMVAVDGYRIFKRNIISVKYDDFKLLIKPHTVKILLKLLPTKSTDLLDIWMDDDSYYITFGDYTIHDTSYNGDFINYKALYNTEFEYSIDVNRSDLIRELDYSIATATDSKKPRILFTVTHNSLTIGQHDGMMIAFNAKYLLDSVKTYSSETVKMQFNTPLPLCIIEGNDLILPVRLNN